MRCGRGEVRRALGVKAAGLGRIWSPSRRAPARDQARAVFLLVLPGIWVGVVLILEFLVPARIQLAPLLAAAPAIACAGTGRRQCVLLAGLCALFALVPIRSVDGGEAGLGQRVGTFGAIMSVAVASYVISHRRLQVLRDLTQARMVAEAAQRVVLRPPRAEIGSVRVAVRSESATAGAEIGGDFYEVVDTPHGVRAVIGDVRGSGLEAVECASVLLGSFREAAYDEPDLRDVVHRLEVSLRRHLGYDGQRPLGTPYRSPVLPLGTGDLSPGDLGTNDLGPGDLWQVSDVLTRPRPSVLETIREEFASVAVVSVRPDGWMELVNRGHPAPYLIRSNGDVSVLEADVSFLPLGLGTLAPLGFACCQAFEVPFVTGDSVLLVTDGVTEARNANGAFFALTEVLGPLVGADTDTDADAEPDEVVSGIHSAVTAHTRGIRTDDLALMLLRKTGNPTDRSR